VNELSLLRGLLLAALFGLFSGLLLSCHIFYSPFQVRGRYHKMLCCCVSCGLEKTAHNMLLYKLNYHPCQQFITRGVKNLWRATS